MFGERGLESAVPWKLHRLPVPQRTRRRFLRLPRVQSATSPRVQVTVRRRFDFQNDVESPVAERPYQPSEALVMANPPMPTPMPTGGRIQSEIGRAHV